MFTNYARWSGSGSAGRQGTRSEALFLIIRREPGERDAVELCTGVLVDGRDRCTVQLCRADAALIAVLRGALAPRTGEIKGIAAPKRSGKLRSRK